MKATAENTTEPAGGPQAEPKHTTELLISRDGTVRAVYSIGVAQLAMVLGEVTTRRASHVEPTGSLSTQAINALCAAYQRLPKHREATRDLLTFRNWLHQQHLNDWWADMTPVAGPVLGPYATRDEALDEERVWLHESGIPVPSGT